MTNEEFAVMLKEVLTEKLHVNIECNKDFYSGDRTLKIHVVFDSVTISMEDVYID